jgi:hypothetical protein
VTVHLLKYYRRPKLLRATLDRSQSFVDLRTLKMVNDLLSECDSYFAFCELEDQFLLLEEKLSET